MASSSGTKNDVGPPRTLTRGMTRTPTRMVDFSNDDNTGIDSELVPSSLTSIAPILRVANEIQKDNPRVAYLCMPLSHQLLNFAFLFYFLSFFHNFLCVLRMLDLWRVFLSFHQNNLNSHRFNYQKFCFLYKTAMNEQEDFSKNILSAYVIECIKNLASNFLNTNKERDKFLQNPFPFGNYRVSIKTQKTLVYCLYFILVKRY